MGDLIAAVATPPGVGGIGIVRLSGEGAASAVQRMARLSGGKEPEKMAGYTCAYGRVFDREGEIDEAVITVFRAPHSYTGEEVVEIAAHGGSYLLNRILRACCENGARLAGAGEFTKRAFLNGKLDLNQAEAVMDLISARGGAAARAALTAREGAVSRRTQEVAEKLTGYAAHLSAWMDYPEEDLIQVDPIELQKGLEECLENLDGLLTQYDAGLMIRDGIATAIVGRPNVGKSTLMNLLSGYERSIVTDRAGTTRDVVREEVRLGEVILNISDTAGIRETQDPIERQGVRLAEKELCRAQLVLAIFDGGEALNEDDRHVMEACRGMKAIAVLNKSDLPQRIELAPLKEAFGEVVSLSARDGEGEARLREAVERLLRLEGFDPGAATAANERQRLAIYKAREEVRAGVVALAAGETYDAVCVCLESAVDALLEMSGKKANAEIVNQVFARFCVGK